jgi:hypothetical protein
MRTPVIPGMELTEAAVAAYNLGSNGLQGWLEGDGDDPSARPITKYPSWWREMNAHLQHVFRGRPDYFDK